MRIGKLVVLAIMVLCFSAQSLIAGNPDRQGEAGAVELLYSPWARSAGLHTMNTSFVSGVEAMRLNVAGLARINKTEINLAHTILFEGTDISVNALGFATKLGETGVLGISLVAVNFGDIEVTTVNTPEGTGVTFSPTFFHIGLAYAKTFGNKVSVGLLVRGVSESTADPTAANNALYKRYPPRK